MTTNTELNARIDALEEWIEELEQAKPDLDFDAGGLRIQITLTPRPHRTLHLADLNAVEEAIRSTLE